MSPHRPSVHEAGHVLAFAPLVPLAARPFEFSAVVHRCLSLRRLAGENGHVCLLEGFGVEDGDLDLARGFYLMFIAAGAASERIAFGDYGKIGVRGDRRDFDAYCATNLIGFEWDDALAAAESYLRPFKAILRDLSWRLDERTPLTKDEANIYWLRCKHEAR